jgi:hypothetical protein
VSQGKDSGHWLFAEMAANKILRLSMDGKLSLYLDNCGNTGWDTWRQGFIQTNGKPPTDQSASHQSADARRAIASLLQERLRHSKGKISFPLSSIPRSSRAAWSHFIPTKTCLLTYLKIGVEPDVA